MQPEPNPRAVVGGNSKVKAGPISADRLKSFVERIERLEEERAAVGGDIRDVYAEAKGVGYDVKTMRKVVAIRKQDAADRAEQEVLLDVYKHALGMDRAVAAVLGGASIREAAAAHGVSKSAVGRAVKAAVPEVRPATPGTVGEIIERLPAHDAETGEIKETGDGAESHAQQTDGVAAGAGEAGGDRPAAGPATTEASAQEEQGAPNLLRDGTGTAEVTSSPAPAVAVNEPHQVDLEELIAAVAPVRTQADDDAAFIDGIIAIPDATIATINGTAQSNDLDDDLPDFDIAAANQPMTADEIAQLQARQEERSRRATAKDEDDLELPAFLRRAPRPELT